MISPASDNQSAARRPPQCAVAPLLWSLVPLAGGIFVVRSGNLSLLVAALLLCLPVSLLPGIHRSRRLVACLSLLAGMSLFAIRHPGPDESWEKRPPREVQAVLRIDELFNARKPARVSGIGTILSTDLPVDTVTGRQAAFYLETDQPSSTKPTPGETLSCKAVLRYLPHLEHLDNYQMYLKNRDIHLSLNQGWLTQSISKAPTAERFRQEIFSSSQALLTSGCRSPDDPGTVLASMLLGNRSLLSDERITLYRKTGTYHLFAVSGLHVGSVFLCLFLLVRWIPLPALIHQILPLLGTWSYVWLTGSSTSAVRAGIMISCLGLARVVFRQPQLFPALILSAWLVLILDPLELFQLGFQLSYGVVLSIILVGLPLAQHLRILMSDYAGRHFLSSKPVDRFLKLLCGGSDIACVSISAGLASMPLIVQHFGLFTPGGVLFGILLNPLVTLVVMAGCLSLVSAPLIGPLGAGTIAVATWPCIRGIEWLLHACLGIPGAVGERAWNWPQAGTLLLVGMLLLAWFLQRLRMSGRSLPGITYLLPHLLVLVVLAKGSIST
ncbi:ComEC/Rec2 family competence protein [Puniceicoccales bacterium CK1056]|uniref:ComEC/Rec2 family competence protein n=1 Tax=Oceanipulchritudo coccoides TaxID=2706888 RepID=A0A6B2M1G2_9BACT|nr:ComEC/Rec2 family competence protein [Oceanipulchritudo coccoides]NDV61974.1 ComEC/Rec2 family competence protein [Oceanipulchritudo coccoides]